MTCEKCQLQEKIKTQAPTLKPIAVFEPLKQVGMDLIGSALLFKLVGMDLIGSALLLILSGTIMCVF